MVISSRLTLALKIAALLFAGLAVVLTGVGFYLYRLSLTLPDLSSGSESLKTAQTSIVYAADGSVIAKWHAGEDRTVVPLNAISQAMRDAVVAIEDERFYERIGVDTQGIFAILRSETGNGSSSRGASTITRQLVKMLFPDEERTFIRKVREALLAFELDVSAEKDDILEAYLNAVYFGHGAYGVEAAARRYFDVSASELTVSQAAMLAGLVRAPGRYSPINEPEAARKRRDEVLARMLELGYISPKTHKDALATDLTLAPPKNASNVAPYFVEYVKQFLIEKFGADTVFTGGLRVYTTLEPGIQKEAERSASHLLSRDDDPEYAVVAIEHRTGRILAMVGGRDFKKNQFNLAVQGRRQPGSVFKPFVLVRAIEEGVSPDQVFDATPYAVRVADGIWRVSNYENQFTAARMTLRAATNWSVNAVYARLIMQIGPEDVVNVARRMGITSPLEPNPAIALGGVSKGVSPLEMASAFGTLGNGGVRVAPVAVTRITSVSGDIVYEPKTQSERVLEEHVVRQTSVILHDVVEAGTGMAARVPGTWVAGKTGTTQSYRDAWFVGYTNDISCAVWVGHREGQIDMTNVRGIQVTGGSFPAEIWSSFITRALQQYRSRALPIPIPGTSTAPPVESLGGGRLEDVPAWMRAGPVQMAHPDA